MFQILNLETKQFITTDGGDVVTFPDGEAANKYCLFVRDQYGWRVQPRKIVNDEKWREREAKKFESGEYSLPDFLKPYVLPDHFVHLSKETNGVLAYTKDEFNGKANLRSKISLKTYLEKFNPVSVATWKELNLQFNLVVLETDGLKFAKTPEEIAFVYTNYDSKYDSLGTSCMRGTFSRFREHPTSVYGAGDLAIAYMADDKNRTIARALVYPEKKIYGRVYGSSTIHDLLKIRGYKKNNYYGETSWSESLSFSGARLRKVKLHGTSYLMPYIDENSLGVDDEGDFFRLRKMKSGEKIGIYNANGTSNPHYREPICCHVCHEEVEADIVRQVYENRNESHYWCLDCARKGTFECRRSGALYNTSTVNKVTMWNKEVWSEPSFENEGFTCAKTHLNYPNSSRVDVRTKNGVESWCDTIASKEAWMSDLTTEMYSNEFESVIYVNRYWMRSKVPPEELKNIKTFVKNGEYYDISLEGKKEEDYDVSRIPVLNAQQVYEYILSRYTQSPA